MARNLNSYIQLMGHGLGKVPDSRHLLIDTFNDAGRALFTIAENPPWYHSWSWTVRDNVEFSIPGGQVQECELPSDFSSLVDLGFQNTFVGQIVTCTAQELNMARRSVQVDPLRVWICFDVGSRQKNKTSAPRNVAAFWPPQTDAITGLSLSYRRDWVDMTENDLKAIPDIPTSYERLLVLLSRAYAVNTEDQAAAFEDSIIAQEIMGLVTSDAGKQPSKGKATHSVRARAGSGRGLSSWWGRPIIRP